MCSRLVVGVTLLLFSVYSLSYVFNVYVRMLFLFFFNLSLYIFSKKNFGRLLVMN
jgi:uncharacterized membrane-anchored protein YitT (DUF2179 family)